MKSIERQRNDPRFREKHKQLVIEQAEQLKLMLPHVQALSEFKNVSEPIKKLIQKLADKATMRQVHELFILANNETYIGNCAAFDRQLSLEEDK